MKNQIMHGDCFEIMKDIDNNSIDLILTDPPYNITACEWDTKIDIEQLWIHFKRIIKPGGCIVMTSAQPFTTDLINSNRKWFRYEWIWQKTMGSNYVNSHKMPIKTHENVLVFYKTLPTYNPQRWWHGVTEKRKSPKTRKHGLHKTTGMIHKKDIYYIEDGYRMPQTVIKVPNPINKTFHSTQKPLELFEYMVKTYTNEGDLVLDPFSGSGTTAIAAHRLKRDFIAIEKDENFYKKSLERFSIPLFDKEE